jgi:hypothetical protein
MQPNWRRLSWFSLVLNVAVVHGASFYRKLNRNSQPAILAKEKLYPRNTDTTTALPIEELDREERQSQSQGQGDAPGKGDYNKETAIMWDAENRFPFSVEALIASIWITMVASLPLVVVWLEGKDITKTQLTQFATMWIIFFSGVYLFTHVLYFQSVHFETIRRLSIVESVYLLAQILTTVGYGDITPAKPRGQVFIAFYVLFSLLVLANVFSEATDIITQRTKAAVAEFTKKMEEVKDMVQGDDDDDEEVQRKFLDTSAPPLDFRGLISSCLFYAFFVVVGCCFFHLYPGEGKTWFQGIYMSVITLSSVGFGAFTPVTEGGKVFGAYWMLFGCAALAAVIGNFTDVFVQLKIRERWDPEVAKLEKRNFFERLPADTDELTFLKQCLIHKKLVEDKTLVEIDKFYSRLAPKGGPISHATLDRYLAAQP